MVEVREKRFRAGRLTGHGLEHGPLLAAAHDRGGNAPHLGELLVGVGHVAVLVHGENPVGGRLQGGARHRQRARELLGAGLERLLGADQFLLGALPREQDAVGVLDGDGAQQTVFVVGRDH